MKLANKVTESIKQAVEQARKTENAVLLSIITPIEEINFPKVLINLPQTEDAFYWQTPDDLGIGYGAEPKKVMSKAIT